MKKTPKRTCVVLLLICSFFTTRAQNYALGFTSANSDYVDFGSNALLNATNIRTMECWVRFSSLATDQEIMSRSISGTGIEMLYYGGNLCFYAMNGANAAWISYPGSNLTTGVWYHVAVAFDGSTAASMRLYVNGVSVGTLSTAGTFTGVGNPGSGTSFKIGQWSQSGSPRLLNGYVDEARVWSVTRTAAQIKAGMYGTVAAGTSGLIAYYNMNNGSGTTVSNSTANSGLDGTLMGSPAPQWVSSPIQWNSGALSFDGVDDKVQAPANSAYDISSGTVEFWAMPTAWATGANVNMTMLGVRGASASRYSFHINSGAVGIWNGLLFTTVPYSFSLNHWYHFAFVSNGISTTVYINGVAQTTTIGAFGTATGQPLVMGQALNSTGFQEPFSGVLDEVRIWNTQRTATQINTYMNNALTGSESGLVALFSMDQGIGAGTNSGLATAIDATSANNHGTLSNFALTGASSNWTNHSLTILPVIIESFTGIRDGGAAVLNWATAQEENSRDFVIERSSDGQLFSPIATVQAAGMSHFTRDYSYTDEFPVAGVNYYRLKEEDQDGYANYSPVISINFSTGGLTGAAGVVLSPNPATTSITWNMTGAAAGPAVLCLNDVSGRTLLTRSFQLQQGANQVTVGLEGLPAGIYVLTMKQTSGVVSKEFQLIR